MFIHSSWADTVDPAACNTNPQVYMNFSRDPERTPFQWDGTKNAGFSIADRTWLPVNPNYVDLNLNAEKSAAKSHFKFYQRLMELRKLDTFEYGDMKIVALNQNVFAYVRELLDHETYVVIVNLSQNYENVDLKVFATLREKLRVVAAAPASDYEEG
jgi:alpha-glucosidase